MKDNEKPQKMLENANADNNQQWWPRKYERLEGKRYMWY